MKTMKTMITNKRYLLKGICLALLVVFFALMGCGRSAPDEVEPEIDVPEEINEIEGIELEPVEVVERAAVSVSSGSTLAIRRSPGTEGKPDGDVLDRVPRGRILRVLDKHGDSRVRDGYTWWEVEDPETGLSGWVAAEFLEVEAQGQP